MKNKLQISPNPFNSYLLISGINGEGFAVNEVVIYNIVGKTINATMLRSKIKRFEELYGGIEAESHYLAFQIDKIQTTSFNFNKNLICKRIRVIF